MQRLRRFASLLALPLLLQLVLAAKAVACTDPASSKVTPTSSTSAMPGMDMPAQPGGNGHSDSRAPAPCDRPFGPSSCQPLAACASGALAADNLTVPPIALIVHDAPPLVVLTPPSHTTRPELPPPRA